MDQNVTEVPEYSLPPLTNGVILRRYKRFLADIELENGRVVTAHCANTGAMTGCWAPGAPAQLSFHDNPRRKLDWSLQRVDMGQGWVGVNTSIVNSIVALFIQHSLIGELSDWRIHKSEPAFGGQNAENARFDFLLQRPDKTFCYTEVKSCTLLMDDELAFPDAVSARARKHLQLLQLAIKQGHRACLIFAVNRPEGDAVSPASWIDPEYADELMNATSSGVKALAIRLSHTGQGVRFGGMLPVRIPNP
ncbi:MAG: DNA/RNA nuclease SfsA [Pseudomonadota bacterium]